MSNPEEAGRGLHGICGAHRCHHAQAQSFRTASQYNQKFEFPYPFEGQQCHFVVTSITGHLTSTDFGERSVLSALLKSPCARFASSRGRRSAFLCLLASNSFTHSILLGWAGLSACSYRKWGSCDPIDLLKMDTPVVKFIADDKKNLETLLKEEGRRAEYVHFLLLL